MDSLRRKKTTFAERKVVAPNQYSDILATPRSSVVPAISRDNSRLPLPLERRRASRRTRSFVHVFFGILGLILIFGLFVFGYVSWKIGTITRSMSIELSQETSVSSTLHGATSLLAPIFSSERAPLPGEADGRTNILLLGKANEKTAGQKLTDTIMIVSLDFERRKIALLSLPRDLYVEIPGTGFSSKLNALYQFDAEKENNAETVRKTVSHITGLPIHGFATLDYDGFIQIVDILGGVSVYVERDLYDPRFPGPNYSYETFSIKKGWQDMNGETALKYVRERHADPEGDFGRAKRQQSVLSAIQGKALSKDFFLDPRAISDSLETLGTHIRTDLSLAELSSLARLKNEFDTRNIASVVVDAWKKESLLRVSHIQVGSVAMFILLPRTGDWNEVRELAENIFDLDRLAARREAIKQENATVVVRNESGTPSLEKKVIRFLSEDLDLPSVRKDISSPAPESEIIPREKSLVIRRGSTEAIHTTDEITQKLGIAVAAEDMLFPASASLESSDIIILLGYDLAKRLSFEEDTVEDIQNSENDLDYQKRLHEALEMERKR
jgi:LCP family protein required for cell wall assembly